MHARPILHAEDPRSRELLVSSILRFATSPGDPEEGDKARRRNVDVTQFLGWRENKPWSEYIFGGNCQTRQGLLMYPWNENARDMDNKATKKVL